MEFQAKIIPPSKTDNHRLWQMFLPKPDPNNEFGSFETVSHFIRINLCMGYTGANPLVEDWFGSIKIMFEGGPQNFAALERVIEWVGNPQAYAY